MSADDNTMCDACWRASCPGTCAGPDPADRIDLERRAAAIEAAHRLTTEGNDQ